MTHGGFRPGPPSDRRRLRQEYADAPDTDSDDVTGREERAMGEEVTGHRASTPQRAARAVLATSTAPR